MARSIPAPLRFLLGAVLVAGIGFVAMVLTSMVLAHSLRATAILLAAIWGLYLLWLVLDWRYGSKVWLAAFVGFGLGVLRLLDRFEPPDWLDIVATLAGHWLGYLVMAFMFIFVCWLPWLAQQVARNLTGRSPESETETPDKTDSSGAYHGK